MAPSMDELDWVCPFGFVPLLPDSFGTDGASVAVGPVPAAFLGNPSYPVQLLDISGWHEVASGNLLNEQFFSDLTGMPPDTLWP